MISDFVFFLYFRLFIIFVFFLIKNIEPKKLKLETENNISVDVTKSPIRNNNEIEKKRCEAKLKLLFKQTNGLINNFGISWLKVLEPEFSKPYFLKVIKFLINKHKADILFSFLSYLNLSMAKDRNIQFFHQSIKFFHGQTSAYLIM